MTREELIIAEAKKYYSGNIQCYDAFLHGVEFTDEHPINVWHNNEEEPSPESLILCSTYVDYEVHYWTSYRKGWKWFVQRHYIYKWMYISHPD